MLRVDLLINDILKEIDEANLLIEKNNLNNLLKKWNLGLLIKFIYVIIILSLGD